MVDTSVGGLLVPEGIIDTVAYAAAQTTDIVYYIYLCLNFSVPK